MSKIIEWLTEKARFPRFVWVVLALGICTVAGALGYRILTASTVMVNATDKFQIAIEAQKEAIQERKEASEVLIEMNTRFDEARVAMDKRFDELIEKMERAKTKLSRPEVAIFSGGGRELVRDISAAQTALREDREKFRKVAPNFKDFRKAVEERMKK